MFSHVVERCVILTGAGRERRLEDLAHAGVVSLSGTDDGVYLGLMTARSSSPPTVGAFDSSSVHFPRTFQDFPTTLPPQEGCGIPRPAFMVMFSETLARPSEDPVSSTANQM